MSNKMDHGIVLKLFSLEYYINKTIYKYFKFGLHFYIFLTKIVFNGRVLLNGSQSKIQGYKSLKLFAKMDQ